MRITIIRRCRNEVLINNSTIGQRGLPLSYFGIVGGFWLDKV